MKTLLLLFKFCTSCLADYGVIQDPDGYTNMRKSGSVKAPVVHKILNHQVFHYFGRLEQPWISVNIDTDDGKRVSGFVHRSRIMPLTKMKKLKQGEAISISYTTQPFVKADHKISQNEHGGVGKIDGLTVWGTDGGLPKTEITGVQLTLNGKKIEVPKRLFANLYEPSKQFNIYSHEGVFYIPQHCSDGAGGYHLVWVVDQKGKLTRWVDSPY
ncbi:hypothetical protein NT6N_18450 [Oceaniferula spumae]|uniref:SH3b domain-containing protein n=1 Tax=Oceaniferula spumae TaxID=2979115 RepID=A0AAT9FLB7_9BACT